MLTKIALILLSLLNIYSSGFAQKSWSAYFDSCNVKGNITIFDYNNHVWMSSDIRDSNSPSLPASTFKIIHTLIALQTGTISTVDDTIKWPGRIDTTKYGYRPDIFRDITIRDAFRLSAGWAYVELAKKIGKDNYLDYLDTCNYGNLDLSIDDPDFWNFGPFAITPINQIETLIGIYEETLPFRSTYFTALKEIMIVEKTDNYTLRAKTGWSRYGGKDTGWWVGYLETSRGLYFFATRIIKDRTTRNLNFSKCRMDITFSVFRDMGIIEKGKKP